MKPSNIVQNVGLRFDRPTMRGNNLDLSPSIKLAVKRKKIFPSNSMYLTSNLSLFSMMFRAYSFLFFQVLMMEDNLLFNLSTFKGKVHALYHCWFDQTNFDLSEAKWQLFIWDAFSPILSCWYSLHSVRPEKNFAKKNVIPTILPYMLLIFVLLSWC